MALQPIHTFDANDIDARLTWHGVPYRAVRIDRDEHGELSVWVLRQTKRGADYKRPNSYVWLTLANSLERFPDHGGADLARYVRRVVDERTRVDDVALAFDLAQLEYACRTMLAMRNADWSTVDARTKSSMIVQTMRDYGAAAIVDRHRQPAAPVKQPAAVSPCTNPLHDHTSTDLDCSDGERIAMTCNGCDQPAHYNDARGTYEHDDADAPVCWLLTNGGGDERDHTSACTFGEPEITALVIRTADVAWIERHALAHERETITHQPYYRVTVPARLLTGIERTRFAGKVMVRATLLDAPDDHNAHALYPERYAVTA